MVNAKCLLFNCDKKHKHQCCYYCDGFEKCRNHCLNNPQKCGWVKFERVKRMTDRERLTALLMAGAGDFIKKTER